ncbi:hypothetical protein EDD18DRAFT_1331841 [Armillaria luteobubalina]|uniref:Uncharacterized protein n=1 Tax=Armillaria luteobubalina TaxID=153913 RepID=A0AA39Q4W9_9AGAR|nr:hypothetical protein EDD18DRAFT_1331841 [Armillaria luteobubalina]
MFYNKFLVLSSLFLGTLAQLSSEVASGDLSVTFVNKHSDSSVRSYTEGTENIFVSFVSVDGGEHEQWDLTKTQGGYAIENVATGGFIKAEVCGDRLSSFIGLTSLTSRKDKRLVITASEGDCNHVCDLYCRLGLVRHQTSLRGSRMDCSKPGQ